ncbi:methyltransferase domain-containing protein [Marivirga salinae]|uniref:Methyltransferase domain-containing protein n=1 Tax=Marivirga salinarum TaxID=3059078 RepID=A0AA49GC95_9BACT|nr:methyltransferase domain-containing protein [Marivirga sp. BDSF4-3]WKK76638.2 methyltransferase domain-containing protein [Marivirga sp. BDSF4-3]
MEIKRRKFQGVLNILSFNRHFYVIGLIVLATTLAGLMFFKVPDFWIWIVVATFLYGLIMPLVVSAYVYDFSGYYDFKWLKKLDLTDQKPRQIVNINAGFDETSFILKNNFPEATLKVFDFYNAKQHTEPAIVRARKVSMVYPDTLQIKSDEIPLDDQSADLIFLLSAAHEIRSHKEKVAFLKECHRICKPNGEVITVEHLRDFPNFLAFTIGVTHFFSRKAWEKAFKEAGFSSFEESKFTPFMSIFTCRP